MEELKWEIIEKNLDKEIEGMDASDDVNWVFDLLLKVNEPTLDELLTYFEVRQTNYFKLYTQSLLDEEYCITGKVNKLINYLNDETVRIAEKHLNEEDVEEVKAVISLTTDIKLSTLHYIINQKTKEKL